MDAIAATRALVDARGPEAVTVDDFHADDVERVAWSGPAIHLVSVRTQLERIGLGEVEYLAARAPDGTPVGKGGIDYAVERGVGVIWQVAIHPELQGLGIGTHLLDVAEGRIGARGCAMAALSVETDNPRARALYERLGYVAYGERETGWPTQLDDGRQAWHSARVVDLRKPV